MTSFHNPWTPPVVTIEGQQYIRKDIAEIKQDENNGEKVRVQQVRPIYSGKFKALDLRLDWLTTMFNPGDEIRIVNITKGGE